ncbi:hypothetical protein ACS0TY_024335 [Phlomoides rotata]
MGYKHSGDAQEVDGNIANETTSVEVEPADVRPEGEHAAEAAADPAEEDSSSAEDEDEQNLRHYSITRDRVRRNVHPPERYGQADLVSYALSIAEDLE